MILSDLLGAVVESSDGERLGRVVDVRFAVDGAPGQLLADARLVGLVVSPHSRASMWGYERTGVRSPWPIGSFIEWRHRGRFLVEWADLAVIDDGRVVLRERWTRRDAALPRHTARRS